MEHRKTSNRTKNVQCEIEISCQPDHRSVLFEVVAIFASRLREPRFQADGMIIRRAYI